MNWRIILLLIGILLVLPSLSARKKFKDTSPLNLWIAPGNLTVDENTDIVFDCIDLGNLHVPIRWLRSDNQPLPKQATFPLPVVGRLDIHKVQVHDSGIYICEAIDYPPSTPGQRVNVTLEVRRLSSKKPVDTGDRDTWAEGDRNWVGIGGVENRKICTTTACHQVSEALLSSMNTSVEPCVDFYQFACGGWEPEKSTSGQYDGASYRFTKLAFDRMAEVLANESPDDIPPIRKMKSINKACVNSGVRGLKDPEVADTILRILKGWKILRSNYTWINDSVTWQEIDRYYEELAGVKAFFDVGTAPDPGDYAALQLNSMRWYWIAKSEWEQSMEFVRTHKGNVSDEQFDKDINNLKALWRKIYKKPNSTEKMIYTNVDSFIEWWNENTTSIASQAKIDWAAFFQRVFKIANLPTTNYTIIVPDANYFRKLKRLLESTDKRIIENWVHYNFLIRISRLSIQFEHMDNPDCSPEEEPAFIHIFAKKYIGNNMKTIVDEMITSIKRAFERQIRNSNWLSVETKERIKEKLSRMEYFVGYPKWFDNETALVEYYKNLKIGETYVDTILSWKKVMREGDIRRWGRPLEETVWYMDATKFLTLNAFYSEARNIIIIPAVNFQLPMTDESLPLFFRYGIHGFAIGHEISHGFHAKEGHYSAYTNETLYNDEMTKIYNERVGCLKGNSTEKPSIEDEADWNGLQIAFLAYEEQKRKKNPNGDFRLPGFLNFTDEQMFFISYSQRFCAKWLRANNRGHSSQDFRVRAIVSNNMHFANAFNCPKNSPMNPEVKCNIWMT